ncbi:MAG: glutamyl-tRNA reductase [Halieaceae bacterium]|nr:glutamyl-tRNA reductase [Halieaceae bacterium]
MLGSVIAIGINHDSASVEMRERVAFAPEKQPLALESLIASTPLEEAVILSTCNRTEIYGATGTEVDVAETSDAMLRWVADYHELDAAQLNTHLYRSHGKDAVTHLVRVAAGLNSMVLGEPQIFGQLKSAYAVAIEAGAIGSRLGQVFPESFRLAKKVRTDTAIGENPVSVAYAAVDLAGHIFSDLSQSKALLLGAGETIELVARHLREAGIRELVIANRTQARAESLAEQFEAEAILLADVPDRLAEADIVISSTASQLPILGKGAVEAAAKARRWRPMLLVDLAVPRDIETQVAELSDVYLYTVDDLRDVVEENMRLRADEASRADDIITAGMGDIESALLVRRSASLVRSYRESALAIQEREIAKALKALERGDAAPDVLQRLARDLTNKLIHAPTTGLRQLAREGDPSKVSTVAAILGVDADGVERDENTTLQ